MKWQKPGKPFEGATNLSSLSCPQEKKPTWETRRVSLRKEFSSSHRATSPYLLLFLLQKPRASLASTRLCPFQGTVPLKFVTEKYQLVSSHQEVLSGAADSFIFKAHRRGALEQPWPPPLPTV